LFIGHYGLGLAGKHLAPQASLGILVAAVSLLDLLWPVFLLLGWEQVLIEPGNTRFTPLNFLSYPISHGLVAVVGWATLSAVIYQLVARYPRGAIVVWFGVISHWFLDLVVHRPDLPLYAGSEHYGFGLWNHPKATIVVEGLIFLSGVWFYLRSTQAKHWIGKWIMWAFVLVLAAFYAANAFGPQPPGVKTIAVAAISFGLLLVLWAGWFDRYREAK
jgi:hypothetical protein